MQFSFFTFAIETNKNIGNMALLSKVTGFWDSFSFVKNVKRARIALVHYLTEEGVKCEVKDGGVAFVYDDTEFFADFGTEDDYAECVITRKCEYDEYEALSGADKASIAAEVNLKCGYHVNVCAYNEEIETTSSFYFTDEKMMINLFVRHLEEINDCISVVNRIALHKIEKSRTTNTAKQRRHIGFVFPEARHDDEEVKISAKL